MPDTIELHELESYLQSIAAGVVAEIRQTDFSDGMRACANILRESHQQSFNTETGPNGQAWTPWHWRRPEASDAHKTLHDTGALLASVIGGPDHIENISKDSLEFGTAKPYAATHQFGADMVTKIPMVGRGGHGYLPAGSEIHIPDRPFIGVSEKTADLLAEAVADAAVENLRRT